MQNTIKTSELTLLLLGDDIDAVLVPSTYTKIGANIEICLGNNQDKFPLHRLAQVKILQKLYGATFLTHTVGIVCQVIVLGLDVLVLCNRVPAAMMATDLSEVVKLLNIFSL